MKNESINKSKKFSMYPITYYESKMWGKDFPAVLWYGVIIVTLIAFSFMALRDGYYYISAIFFSIIILASIIVYFYKTATITIYSDYFVYKKGGISWTASSKEIKKIYVENMMRGPGIGDIRIDTNSGSTYPFASEMLRRKTVSGNAPHDYTKNPRYKELKSFAHGLELEFLLDLENMSRQEVEFVHIHAEMHVPSKRVRKK